MSTATNVEDMVDMEQEQSEGRRVKVRIPRERGDEREYKYVSINGYTYMIKKGAWVEVPEEVALLLQKSQDDLEVAEAYKDMVANQFLSESN